VVQGKNKHRLQFVHLMHFFCILDLRITIMATIINVRTAALARVDDITIAKV